MKLPLLSSLLLLGTCWAADEIPQPTADAAPLYVTVEYQDGRNQTGLYTPKTKSLQMDFGGAKVAVAVDPGKVSHWYNADEPAPPAKKTATAAPSPRQASPEPTTTKRKIPSAPTASGPGAKADGSTPVAAAPEAKEPEDPADAGSSGDLRDRWLRLVTACDGMSNDDFATATVGKFRVAHQKHAVKMAKIFEDPEASERESQALAAAALADLKEAHPAIEVSFHTRKPLSKDSAANCRIESGHHLDASGKFDPRKVPSGLYMDSTLLPIEVINKITATTSNIRQQSAAFAKKREPSTITADQVFAPGDITWTRKLESDGSFALHGEFRATVGCGVLPGSLDYAVTFTDLAGKPIMDSSGRPYPTLYTSIDDKRAAEATAAPTTAREARKSIGDTIGWHALSWEWDSERYYQDPGLEILDLQHGTYTVMGDIVIPRNRTGLPMPSDLSFQDRLLLTSTLTDPTKSKATLRFTRVKYGSLSWPLTPTTTTAPKAP